MDGYTHESKASERLSQIRTLVEEWATKQGHERCWYYPEVFRAIAEICGSNVSFLGCEIGWPTRAEFEAGCRKYTDEQYGISWQDIVQSPFAELPDPEDVPCDSGAVE